jgi:hypothetical protein
LNVPEEDVITWFAKLGESIDGISADFVFNMDEMGHAEYADAKDELCYVPS